MAACCHKDVTASGGAAPLLQRSSSVGNGGKGVAVAPSMRARPGWLAGAMCAAGVAPPAGPSSRASRSATAEAGGPTHRAQVQSKP